jgi:hypothetical protein
MPEGRVHPLPKHHALAVASKAVEPTNHVDEYKSLINFRFATTAKLPLISRNFTRHGEKNPPSRPSQIFQQTKRLESWNGVYQRPEVAKQMGRHPPSNVELRIAVASQRLRHKQYERALKPATVTTCHRTGCDALSS